MFLVLSNNIKIFFFLFTVFKLTTAHFLLTILKLLGSKIIFNRGKQQMFSFTSHSDHILTNPMHTLNNYAVCLPFLCLILMERKMCIFRVTSPTYHFLLHTQYLGVSEKMKHYLNIRMWWVRVSSAPDYVSMLFEDVTYPILCKN